VVRKVSAGVMSGALFMKKNWLKISPVELEVVKLIN